MPGPGTGWVGGARVAVDEDGTVAAVEGVLVTVVVTAFVEGGIYVGMGLLTIVGGGNGAIGTVTVGWSGTTTVPVVTGETMVPAVGMTVDVVVVSSTRAVGGETI